jgi:hypothetical protein
MTINVSISLITRLHNAGIFFTLHPIYILHRAKPEFYRHFYCLFEFYFFLTKKTDVTAIKISRDTRIGNIIRKFTIRAIDKKMLVADLALSFCA